MPEPAPPSGTPPPVPRPNATPTPPPLGWRAWLFLGVLLVGMALWQNSSHENAYPAIPYSRFYSLVEADQVESIALRGQSISGKLKSTQDLQPGGSQNFQTLIPQEDPNLLPLLRQHGVAIDVKSVDQPFAVQLLLTLLPWVLIVGVWVWLSRRAQNMMSTPGGPFGAMLKGRTRRFDKETAVSVTFSDVAGLKAAKQDLREIVSFLTEPERFRHLGGKVPRGVLLVGPPGTGKTLLARAVAGEAGVPFFSISGSEFIEMFVGVGASRVRDLFAEARKVSPAIVFIDEIDAVGRSRGTGLGGGNDEREQTLNQLLSEMDGFDRTDLTVVLAATNRPDVLDPALLRPGRFDRRVIVDRPERAARRAILEVHTRDKPLADDVDLDRVAEATPGFSGADLANLANEAALSAVRRNAESIGREDFTDAYDKIVLGDRREATLDPEEKQRVAVHEAGHAVVAHYTPHSEPLRRVSIIPRGMALGVTEQTPAADRHIMTQPELESRLRVLLGGYASEREVMLNVSSGAENDLKQATEIAFKMVAHFGMSDKVGPVFHEHKTEHAFLGQRIAAEGGTSDVTVHQLEDEVRRLLLSARDQAQQTIISHRPALDALVLALLKQETLEREELTEILGEPVQAPASVSLAASLAPARGPGSDGYEALG